MMSRATHVELWTCLDRESFMKEPLIGLVAVTTAVIVILDYWATVIVARQIDLPAAQKRLQLIFIWLLPVVGAMIALRIHRPTNPIGHVLAVHQIISIRQASGPKTLARIQTGCIDRHRHRCLADLAT